MLSGGENMKAAAYSVLCFFLVIVGHAPGWLVARAFRISIDAFHASNPTWTPFPNYTLVAKDLLDVGIHGFVAGAFASIVMQWIVKNRLPSGKYIMPTVVAVWIVAAVLVAYAIFNPDFLNMTLLGALVQFGAITVGLFFKLSK
jgi:hypothetical protein